MKKKLSLLLCGVLVFLPICACGGEVSEDSTIVSETSTNYLEDTEFSEGLDLYSTGEYNYILPADLNKYHANMEGVKFCTVICIDDISDENDIQSTLDDGYMMSNFHTTKKYDIDVDEVIAIIGDVGGFTDYGFLGKSLDFNNCYVLAVGDDAEDYKLNESHEFFDEYFVVTSDVANSNSDISEEEFKNICETLDYEDILRNPDNYEDVYCKIKGTVEQSIEGFLGFYSIFVEDSNGDIWGCNYYYEDGESHLLEGDVVTIYGVCDGTTTAETLSGKQVTLPYVDIEYIEQN